MFWRNPLHRKNQAPKGAWSLAKSVATVSWFMILSRQLNYNTVVDLFQVKLEKGGGFVCIFYVQALPQRMAQRFMPEIMVNAPLESGLVQVLNRQRNN